MKNLTKSFLLLISSFGLIVLLSSCSHHGKKGCSSHKAEHKCTAGCKTGGCDYKSKSDCKDKKKKECKKDCKTGCKKECGHKKSAEKSVWFVAPENNATVKGKVTVKFGVKGMTVSPAGKLIKSTGHHHLIINGGYIAKGNVVPADAKHIHFGKGQMETTLDLPKGKHTITMQFADGAHISYGKEMSSTITVNVE